MRLRTDRGSALMVVLIFSLALAAAGAALLPAVINADRNSESEAAWVRAGHIADAGIEHVFASMRAGDDVSGNNILSLGDGSAFARVDPVAGRTDTWIVESTANLAERPEMMRTVRATVRRKGTTIEVLRWERP